LIVVSSGGNRHTARISVGPPIPFGMVAQSWTPLCHALEFKLAPQVVFHVIECGVASIDTAGVTALHAWELAFP